MSKMTVRQLRAATDMLLSHLESIGVNEVDIAEDFYWDVPASSRYDQYAKPEQHTIGQISDDMSELQRMLDGTAPAVGYGLVWLAVVLRRVGETSIA